MTAVDQLAGRGQRAGSWAMVAVPIATGQTPAELRTLAHPARAHPLLVPDMGEAALLADPGLVHEPQLDPPGLGVPVRHLPDQAGQVF